VARPKLFLGGVMTALALTIPVASGAAFNSGTPPGPPGVSGNPPRGADVLHCAAEGVNAGVPGVTVFVRGGFPVFRCGGA
jgi:hypothetical protein